MYSTPLKVDGKPESIPKDYENAHKDIARNMNRDAAREFKFIIKGIQISISDNDTSILNNKMAQNTKDINVNVTLTRKKNNKNSKTEKPIEPYNIKIGDHTNAADNWARFIEELLKIPELNLDKKEKQNVANMLKGYWQKRFGMKFCDAVKNDDLTEPLRKYNKEEKHYRPYIPYIMFAHGTPKNEEVEIGTDKNKNAILKTNFPFETYMTPSSIFEKFEKNFPLKDNKEIKGLVHYVSGFEYHFPNLKLYEKTQLKANKKHISYQQADVLGHSPLMLKYFKNKEDFINSLQINNITDEQIEALIPDIKEIESSNKKSKPTDKEIAKDLIKEIRLFAGLSILDYQAKLIKKIKRNKNLTRQQKSILLKKLNSHTELTLNNLKNLSHPKDVANLLKISKDNMDRYLKKCLDSYLPIFENTNKLIENGIENNIANHIERASLEYDRILITNINKLERLADKHYKKYDEYNGKYEILSASDSKKDQKKALKYKANADISRGKAESFTELAKELRAERKNFLNKFKEKYQLSKIKEDEEAFDGKNILEEIQQHTEKFISNLNTKMKDISEKLNTHKKRNGFTDSFLRGISLGIVSAAKWIVKKCTSSSNAKENTIDLSKHDKHCNNTDSYSALEEVANSVVMMKNRLVNSYQYASNPNKFLPDQRSAQFHNDLASTYQQAAPTMLSL